MKTKLVPVPNIKKRELMTALMDGRTFIANIDNAADLYQEQV